MQTELDQVFMTSLLIQYRVIFQSNPDWLPVDPLDRESLWHQLADDRQLLGKYICSMLEVLQAAWPAYAAGVKVEAE